MFSMGQNIQTEKVGKYLSTDATQLYDLFIIAYMFFVSVPINLFSLQNVYLSWALWLGTWITIAFFILLNGIILTAFVLKMHDVVTGDRNIDKGKLISYHEHVIPDSLYAVVLLNTLFALTVINYWFTFYVLLTNIIILLACTMVIKSKFRKHYMRLT